MTFKAIRADKTESGYRVGFVTMEDADADKAIAMFDGKDFEGRNIKVNEAKPMEERPRRSFDSRNDNRRSF